MTENQTQSKFKMQLITYIKTYYNALRKKKRRNEIII